MVYLTPALHTDTAMVLGMSLRTVANYITESKEKLATESHCGISMKWKEHLKESPIGGAESKGLTSNLDFGGRIYTETSQKYLMFEKGSGKKP